MADPTPYKFTIAFTDPDLSNEEREAAAQSPQRQLKNFDGVTLDRVSDPSDPDGKKGLGILWGLLQAEATAANGLKVLGFIGSRLKGKVIEIKVEGNGKSLEVKASSPEELKLAIAEATKFIEGE